MTVCVPPPAIGPKAALAGCTVHPDGPLAVTWPLIGELPLLATVTWTGTVEPARPDAGVAVAETGLAGIGWLVSSSISASEVDASPPLVNSIR